MENVVYGYITLETLALLGEEPYLDQLKIVVAGEPVRREARPARGGGRARRSLESRGPSRAAHRRPEARASIRTPTSWDCCFSAMSVLRPLRPRALSGILVVNLMTALMASQIRQIGVMKTIGGTRRPDRADLPGSGAAPGRRRGRRSRFPRDSRTAARFAAAMAVFLNFDIASFAVPAWVFLLGGRGRSRRPAARGGVSRSGGGAASRSARRSPTSACARPRFGASALRPGRSPGSEAPRVRVLLAIRNSFRRRTRLALTLATLAAGGVFFLSALNVRASMIRTLDRLFRGEEVRPVGRPRRRWSRSDAVERAVRKTPGVRAVGGLDRDGGVDSPDRSGGARGHAGIRRRPTAAEPAGLHGGGATASGPTDSPSSRCPPERSCCGSRSSRARARRGRHQRDRRQRRARGEGAPE